MVKVAIVLGCTVATVIILKIVLDMASHALYTPLHTHWCFERHVKEPWERDPLGRIEQDGINHVLVTLGIDAKPLHRDDSRVHAFAMPKTEFHQAYKEVPCPQEWK